MKKYFSYDEVEERKIKWTTNIVKYVGRVIKQTTATVIVWQWKNWKHASMTRLASL